MYKMGDMIELECYIDAIDIRKCNSGHNKELRKYHLRYSVNDHYAGAYEYEDFIAVEGCAWLDAKVKVKAEITEIDGDLYYIKLSNGCNDIIGKAVLPERFKKGDNVRVECRLAAYEYYEDRDFPDRTKSKLYIRTPDNTGIYTLRTDYPPKVLDEMNTVSITGKVTYVDNSGIDVSAALDDTNVVFTITDKHLDKVEVVE